MFDDVVKKIVIGIVTGVSVKMVVDATEECIRSSQETRYIGLKRILGW